MTDWEELPATTGAFWPAPDDPDAEDLGPFQIRFRWANVDGRTVCVGVTVQSIDAKGRAVVREAGEAPAEVTATLMRRIPFGTLMMRGLSSLASDVRRRRRLEAKGEGELSELQREHLDRSPARDESTWAPVEAAAEERARPKRRQRTARDVRRVAEVYLQALEERRPPRMAVAEALEVSPDMASKWIRQARDAGFLAATQGGRPSGPGPELRR